MTKQGKTRTKAVDATYRPGARNDITDVPLIRVGNAQDRDVATGVSVVFPEQPMVCAVDVRGGGPGTRETDLLDPATLVQTVDAIVLSGGSTFGLAAADAVSTGLGAMDRGFALVDRPGVPRSPIVPAAILYDLANGGNKNWGENPPYQSLGRAAFDHAVGGSQTKTEGQADIRLTLGASGAGYGARAGQEAGGLGSASLITPDGLIIGALIAVNSFGSVRIPDTDVFWAWPYELIGEFGDKQPDPANSASHAEFPADTKAGAMGAITARENTTIGVVAVSTPLSQSEAKRIAIMAQDGMARAIRPVHAPTDGDVIFVLAPQSEGAGEAKEVGAGPVDPLTLTRLGTHAADCVARAIARGVYAANREK